MSEPLIGPSKPLKVWTPNEVESGAEHAPENAAFATSNLSRPDALVASDDASLRRVMVGLWVGCVVAIQVTGFVYQPLRQPENLYMFAIWLGAVRAGWAATVWISSRWAGRPLTRVLFLVAMFAWHGLGISVARDVVASRYIVMLGSYGLIQAVVFHWLGIPRWQILRLPLQRPASPFGADSVAEAEGQDESRPFWDDSIRGTDRGDITRQFGIGDLLAVTTVVAVLITAGKSYGSLLASSFWWGLVVSEAVLLAVAVLSVLSGLSKRPVAIIAFFVLALAVGVGGSFVLNSLESVVKANSPLSLWQPYAILMTMFSILMVGFAALSMTPLRTHIEPSEGAWQGE